MFDKLHIFTQHGHTFTFKGVEITTNNETHLAFTYRAVSDGHVKTGNFPKTTICGWATSGDTEAQE